MWHLRPKDFVLFVPRLSVLRDSQDTLDRALRLPNGASQRELNEKLRINGLGPEPFLGFDRVRQCDEIGRAEMSSRRRHLVCESRTLIACPCEVG